ncbi:alpha/beta fold hydrolase [Ramlibacter tataouinensis]|uniref:Hydrolase-like protein n=1 Tax=Ramlibacter tataouinensis (strain ATCC BAA-407 / DSM 14655 / LMG 21543 / TTB310) TaxID=365046 RepID=F5XWA1_RAMTT|nr:alpha/beta fold hydrolase [Ramlibacter tataouinensis]AEG91671.1 hydrolase-like protein [Ramlibacter tataouinensis TTB310]
MSAVPATDDPAVLLAHATTLTTPCGTGHMVWRRWGAGRPLVLLHGGSGSWTHWIRSIAPLTAAGRELWVPDLPGFGDSDVPPGGGDADAVAPVLLQGLATLFGAQPVEVAAFSFGSLVASLAEAQAPGHIARLVIVGAPALALAQPLRLRLWQHLEGEAARREVHRHNLGVLMLADAARITEATVDLHAANMARDRLRERRLVRTDAMARALRALRCPLHAIYGRHDALYADRWPQLQALLEGMPALRSLRFVEDAGHWVQYEAPEGFHALLAQALGGGCP